MQPVHMCQWKTSLGRYHPALAVALWQLLSSHSVVGSSTYERDHPLHMEMAWPTYPCMVPNTRSKAFSLSTLYCAGGIFSCWSLERNSAMRVTMSLLRLPSTSPRTLVC